MAAIAYLQPVTRGDLSDLFDKEVSSDTVAMRDAGLLGSGRHSPTPGASYTYVTTKHFLSTFGMEMLRDLPDLERLEDAALLSTLDGATGPPGAMSRRTRNRCLSNEWSGSDASRRDTVERHRKARWRPKGLSHWSVEVQAAAAIIIVIYL